MIPTSTHPAGVLSPIYEANSRESIRFSNGDQYEGEMRGGAPHGKGTLTFSVSDAYLNYSGNFENGKFHGEGILNWKNGRKHEGEFKLGQIDGKGTQTYDSDSMFLSYTGDFQKGQWHGYGELKWKDGDECEGQFVEGKFYTGKGRIAASGEETEYKEGKPIPESVCPIM